MLKVAGNKNRKQKQSDTWFDNLIDTINTHKLIYDTKGVNYNNINELYDTFIRGDLREILKLSQNHTHKGIITNMIMDYIEELKSRKINFSKIYIDYNNKGLLTWFVIEDDDIEAEKQIYLASAKVNVNYYDFGYSITNSIIEKSDNIPAPSHYKPLQ